MANCQQTPEDLMLVMNCQIRIPYALGEAKYVFRITVARNYTNGETEVEV
jgi:hypothetical protein